MFVSSFISFRWSLTDGFFCLHIYLLCMAAGFFLARSLACWDLCFMLPTLIVYLNSIRNWNCWAINDKILIKISLLQDVIGTHDCYRPFKIEIESEWKMYTKKIWEKIRKTLESAHVCVCVWNQIQTVELYNCEMVSQCVYFILIDMYRVCASCSPYYYIRRK